MNTYRGTGGGGGEGHPLSSAQTIRGRIAEDGCAGRLAIGLFFLFVSTQARTLGLCETGIPTRAKGRKGEEVRELACELDPAKGMELAPGTALVSPSGNRLVSNAWHQKPPIPRYLLLCGTGQVQRCHGHRRHVQEAQRVQANGKHQKEKKLGSGMGRRARQLLCPCQQIHWLVAGTEQAQFKEDRTPPPRLWPIPKTAPDREQAMWWHVRNSPAPKRMLEGAAGGVKVETQASRQASGIRNPASNTPHKLI
ncbi:hypothetical protein BGX38DRAFT_1141842 [Terfezia claveryi]|nr:hypothetical protein BGX38DRAFT_1141842 [Terfezia claveryi]